MGNAAMCKVCGSDKGLRTVGSLSNLDQNALPDFYCMEHFPVQPSLMLVRSHAGRCSKDRATSGSRDAPAVDYFRKYVHMKRFLSKVFEAPGRRCQLVHLNVELYLFWSLT